MPFKTDWYRFILTDKGHCDIMVTNSKEGGNGYMNTRYPENNTIGFLCQFQAGYDSCGRKPGPYDWGSQAAVYPAFLLGVYSAQRLC